MSYRFPAPLARACIVSRPNRFIMVVRCAGSPELRVHCPVPGAMRLELAERPCLIAMAPAATLGAKKARSTQATVFALECAADVAVHPQVRGGGTPRTWIGINQTLANTVVAALLQQNAMRAMVDAGAEAVTREVTVAGSRLDFRVGDHTFIEVKMPLMFRDLSQTSSGGGEGGRLLRHLGELATLVRGGGAAGSTSSRKRRAILLLVFMYDAEVFTAPTGSVPSDVIPTAVAAAMQDGVEMWQANMAVDPMGIALTSLFPLRKLFADQPKGAEPASANAASTGSANKAKRQKKK